MDNDAAERDAGLLPDLAADGFLDGLGRLDKAGQGGIPVLRPAFLAAEQDTMGVMADDGHDDGGVCTRETKIRDSLSCCAVGAVFGGSLGGCGPDGCGEGGEVFGGAGPFCACVNRESWLAALSAKGVAGVPVEEGARLGVDGRLRGGKRHVHTAFDEFEAAGLH